MFVPNFIMACSLAGKIREEGKWSLPRGSHTVVGIYLYCWENPAISHIIGCPTSMNVVLPQSCLVRPEKLGK